MSSSTLPTGATIRAIYWMQAGEDEMSLYSRINKDCRKRNLTVQIFYCAAEDRGLSENIAAAYSIEQIHCVLK